MAHFSSKPCDQANAQCCCSGWIEADPCYVAWQAENAIEAKVMFDNQVVSTLIVGSVNVNQRYGEWQLWIRCAEGGPMILANTTESVDENADCACCVRQRTQNWVLSFGDTPTLGLIGTYVLPPSLETVNFCERILYTQLTSFQMPVSRTVSPDDMPAGIRPVQDFPGYYILAANRTIRMAYFNSATFIQLTVFGYSFTYDSVDDVYEVGSYVAYAWNRFPYMQELYFFPCLGGTTIGQFGIISTLGVLQPLNDTTIKIQFL